MVKIFQTKQYDYYLIVHIPVRRNLAGNEYGFLTDGSGNKITGYDLLKTVGSCEIPVDGIFESGDVTHSLSLDELEEKLKGLYNEQGLEW